MVILKRLLQRANLRAPVLDRPIFLVGCSKSGTSLLGLLFGFHPLVGPKHPRAADYASAQDFLDAMLTDSVFDRVAHDLEYKEVWDAFLPVGDVALRTGAELTLLHNPLTRRQQADLVRRLTASFRERRFFAKAPFNTFRIHVLRDMFPDAKLIAIHRDGRDVIASWGRKQNRWQTLGGFAEAIPLMARKWNEAVDHVEAWREQLDVKTVRYEDLLADHPKVLRELFAFCGLDYPSAIFDGLRLSSRTGTWMERIPEPYHAAVQALTERNRRRIGRRAA